MAANNPKRAHYRACNKAQSISATLEAGRRFLFPTLSPQISTLQRTASPGKRMGIEWASCAGLLNTECQAKTTQSKPTARRVFSADDVSRRRIVARFDVAQRTGRKRQRAFGKKGVDSLSAAANSPPGSQDHHGSGRPLRNRK